VKKGCQEIMIIKKIFKLISKTKKKILMNKTSAINSVGAISTLIGRRKVMFLKKIGSEKKTLIKIIN
tara:strand:+ start:1531 stop:1731 length:201 start_codon:yes stop_codon:yes gene_type:complete